MTAPILCYVTDRKLLAGSEGGAGPEVLAKIREAIAAGVDWVQIREKDMEASELLRLVQEAVRAAYHDRTGNPISTAPRLTVPPTVANRTLPSASAACGSPGVTPSC